MPISRPAPVRTDGSNAFARRSMAERVPRIIGEVAARNPDYPPSVQEALQKLQADIAGDQPLRLPRLPAPDYDLWTERFEPHEGDTWLGAEWLFSELLAYRLVLEACRYWTTRRDPFDPFKEEELASEALWEALARALSLEGSRAERLEGHLLAALWGNRLDYSIQAAAAQGAQAVQDDHLLANDLPQVAAHLEEPLEGGGGPASDAAAVHVIMDNAGTEQAVDFALADFLLEEGLAQTVVLHIKMQPTLVSDATGKDVRRLLEAMEARGGGAAAALAARMRQHAAAGRLDIVPDFFWTTDGRLSALPPRLQEAFRGARLVISKGDLNYRRTTGDALWPPGSTLADAMGGFPAPLLALRTVKSDTLVGVEPATVDRLDAEQEGNWRTDGTYGVAQFALPEEV